MAHLLDLPSTCLLDLPSPFGILDLPNEVLELILAAAEPRDARNLRRVCTQFAALRFSANIYMHPSVSIGCFFNPIVMSSAQRVIRAGYVHEHFDSGCSTDLLTKVPLPPNGRIASFALLDQYQSAANAEFSRYSATPEAFIHSLVKYILATHDCRAYADLHVENCEIQTAMVFIFLTIKEYYGTARSNV